VALPAFSSGAPEQWPASLAAGWEEKTAKTNYSIDPEVDGRALLSVTRTPFVKVNPAHKCQPDCVFREGNTR